MSTTLTLGYDVKRLGEPQQLAEPPLEIPGVFPSKVANLPLSSYL